MAWIARSMCLGVVVSCTQVADAQVPPSYDFNFATIGALNNAPCNLADPGGISYSAGRGSVGYEYRMSRLEVTTSQWMEFVNSYSVLGGSWTFFAEPIFWGAEIDPSYSGPGRRYRLSGAAQAANFPVGGISWRNAAMFCNWLHNNKAPGLQSIQNGAYDTSTFTGNPNGTFNDQITHNSGARFWIPTYDEWLKAAHYDPNRYGAGQEGWWMYSTGSDTAPLYGPPGSGTANAGFTLAGFEHWSIPLGSYPVAASPWGLLDVAGATAEWTEYVFDVGAGPEARGVEGSAAGWGPSLSELNDRITRLGSGTPWFGASYEGLRIASAVPSPSSTWVFLLVAITARRQRNCK